MSRVHLHMLAALVAAAALFGSRTVQSDRKPRAAAHFPRFHLPATTGAARAQPADGPRCPPEMVDVAGSFCIDRWEISLEDATSGRRLSPYYHPRPALAQRDRKAWQRLARTVGPMASHAVALPELPDWQLQPNVVPKAVSAPGRVPNAFLDLESARDACRAAGKRLCRLPEWLRACRGEMGLRHGYSDRYDPARCNLASPVHPASLLHGSSRPGLADPRLNLVEHDGKPLLKATGTLLGCATPHGNDGVYDMLGNLDEWIEDPKGTFVGGFYARETEWGCDARIEVHSADYYDYSLGARCCR